ncbi:MAG TPA: hypothetical protein VM911_19530 [Pyrinomonadaceae bacterium]|jgi:hypothetical protein|nr:hypothetical protein [Pyrinomonadaceae bacterium]
MKAGRVHSVIAAGIENPRLLARWQQEPELLSTCGVEPDKLDLDALWKFAGLTAKVRHNGLRADFPLTFRLLNVAGLEIEVFASYASFRAAAGLRYADTTEERTQDLLAFLEHWLDFDRLEHALLWDVMRYERALSQLSKLDPESNTLHVPKSIARNAAPRATSVPRVCGQIILHEMRCDPREVGQALLQKSPRLENVSPGVLHFCYWRRGAAAEIHILQLDELGFYLLSLVDGKRTASVLSSLIGGSRRPARGFLKALGELASVGVIAFKESPRQAL